MGRVRSRVVCVVAAALTCAVLGVATAAPVVAKPVLKGPEIKLLAKQTGVGPHPILRWKAASGAARYLVVVQTPRGRPYWTWQGTETSVRFGGGPLDAPKNTEGASLVGSKVWFVIGFDAQGDAVASSGKRKISP